MYKENEEKIKEEWVIGIGGDHFNCDDTYPSKEEAIKAGRKELMNAKPYNQEPYAGYSEVFNDYIYNDIICFYVGRLTRPKPKADIDNIIEDLANEESYIYGVYYDGFLEDVTEEQKKDLEKEINKVIQNWLDKYDLRDYGFLIKNMEMVRV